MNQLVNQCLGVHTRVHEVAAHYVQDWVGCVSNKPSPGSTFRTGLYLVSRSTRLDHAYASVGRQDLADRLQQQQTELGVGTRTTRHHFIQDSCQLTGRHLSFEVEDSFDVGLRLDKRLAQSSPLRHLNSVSRIHWLVGAIDVLIDIRNHIDWSFNYFNGHLLACQCILNRLDRGNQISVRLRL